MKKLALAIGFAAYVVFGASSGSLAASKIDNGAGVATSRDMRIWSETATNARLLFVNEAFYPDTTSTVDAILAHRIGERAAAQAATDEPVLAHRKGERALAEPNTSRTDTERMICDGDICILP